MITVHLSGENWKNHSVESVAFSDADMSDSAVRSMFHELVRSGFVNVNCVMEDSQASLESGLRYTHAYEYNHNGDIERFRYIDSYRQIDEFNYHSRN